MHIKFSLTKKIILLLLIPITFEIGFVVLLVYLQNQAEAEAERALKAHEISDRLNLLTFDVFTLFKTADETRHVRYSTLRGIDRVMARADALFGSYAEKFAKLKIHYEALHRLVESDSDLTVAIDKSWNAVNEAQAIVSEVEQNVRAGRFRKVALTLDEDKTRISGLMTGLVTQEFLVVAKHQRDVAEESSRRQIELRRNIVLLAIIGLAVNIAFSLVLARFLLNGITARLAKLNDNAERIAERRPLLPAMQGSDEISLLDGAIRKMAKQIEKDAEMRQEVVNMLTHDMRSPLMAIQGSLELLESGLAGSLNERGEKLVKMLDRNASRMKLLISDLLDSQKIQAGMMSLERVDIRVADMFEEIRSSLAEWLSEESIAINCEPTSLVIRGDREKLQRVLFNLVSNAVKYSPQGSTITLSAIDQDGMVEIVVADQGRGIQTEMLQMIFERFQQADKADRDDAGGSGLGLFICKSIVELHGGRIWATSEIGKGSSFHFTIGKS